MAITVVTNLIPNATGAAAGTSLPAAGEGFDFAALLGQQMLAQSGAVNLAATTAAVPAAAMAAAAAAPQAASDPTAILVAAGLLPAESLAQDAMPGQAGAAAAPQARFNDPATALPPGREQLPPGLDQPPPGLAKALRGMPATGRGQAHQEDETRALPGRRIGQDKADATPAETLPPVLAASGAPLPTSAATATATPQQSSSDADSGDADAALLQPLAADPATGAPAAIAATFAVPTPPEKPIAPPAGQPSPDAPLAGKEFTPAAGVAPLGEPAKATAAALAPSVAANTPGQGETANIAGEAQSGSGNAQTFAATLAAQGGAGQAAAGQSTAPARDTPPATAQVATPLHEGRWSRDFGDKVVWLAKNEQQVAHININPPQLGPVHITLNLAGEQASAVFASPHAEVRQAIADAMPQLRDMLAGAGINLGQANVGSQMPQQNGANPQQFSNASRSGNDNAILHADGGQAATALPASARSGRGLVDLFA